MKYLKYWKLFELNSPLLSLSDNVDYDLISIIEGNFDKDSSILEISCGNGADSFHLKDLGYDITCTEYDDNYVNNAINLGLNCIKHDSRDKFPFDDNQFDLVYSRLGLHYFTEVELDSIFKELSRIGNSILITVKVEEDDFKTGKVIISPEKWENIINKYFNIVHFDINQGKLYGKDSKWLKIFAK